MPEKATKNAQNKKLKQKTNRDSKTIGYLRVSTGDQELEKNKSDILHLANNKNLGQVKFIEEKISGKVSWKKRKIAKILEELKEGDVIVVSELRWSSFSGYKTLYLFLHFLFSNLTRV
jgi:DNA invertase Pin-like site-specific DNA recombinase